MRWNRKIVPFCLYIKNPEFFLIEKFGIIIYVFLVLKINTQR